MKRRNFLKTSFAAVSFSGLSCVSTKNRSRCDLASTNREYYEPRIYRLKPGTSHDLLDVYLEKAVIPALNRLGIKPVGVFTETEPKNGPAVYLLIPHPSIESFATATAQMSADPEYQKAGADYLQLPNSNPTFERIDSWFMLVFAGLPKLELPALSRERKPRIFELRTYESYSEQKALKQVEMFNAGEIDVMREVNLGPVFYGQALIGGNLPHLTYTTCSRPRHGRRTRSISAPSANTPFGRNLRTIPNTPTPFPRSPAASWCRAHTRRFERGGQGRAACANPALEFSLVFARVEAANLPPHETSGFTVPSHWTTTSPQP